MATAGVHCTNCSYMLKDANFTQWSRAELRSYLNKAVRMVTREISAKHPEYWLSTGEALEQLYTLAANVEDYALPATFFSVVSIVNTAADASVTELDALSPEQARETDAEGYQLIQGNLRVRPVPTAAGPANGLELLYIGTPAQVAADGANVPLGNVFGDLIELITVGLAKMRQEENWQGFAALLRTIRSELNALIATRNTAADAGLSVDLGPTI